MKFPKLALVVLAASAGAATPRMPRADTLDHDGLLQRVAGSTIHYRAPSEDVYEYLASDGSIHGESSVHGLYQARWRLFEGDSICFEHDDPMASGCVRVKLNGSMLEYHRRDGVVEGPFEILAGNPLGL